MKTFQERYCAARRCRPAAFVDHVLWHCLHRHVWPVMPWMRLVAPTHFAADRELIASIGRMRSWAEAERELRDFASDYRNRDWWRRVARLRLSTRRLRRLVRSHFRAEGTPGSVAQFS